MNTSRRAAGALRGAPPVGCASPTPPLPPKTRAVDGSVVAFLAPLGARLPTLRQ